jgi:hypothetical protein
LTVAIALDSVRRKLGNVERLLAPEQGANNENKVSRGEGEDE